MAMFDLILDWVIDPILNFFERRYFSGKWHWSHLFPVATIAFAGIWWLGGYLNSGLLAAIGAAGTVGFGIANLVTWIPREVGDWRDTWDYIERKKREAKEKEAQEAATRNEMPPSMSS